MREAVEVTGQLSLAPVLAPRTEAEWLAGAEEVAVEHATRTGSVTASEIWDRMPPPPPGMNRKRICKVFPRKFKALRIEKSHRKERHGGYETRWILA